MSEVPRTPVIPASSDVSSPPALARPLVAERADDLRWYALAMLLGLCNGLVEVALSDLMVTSFLALAFCMLLGAIRPRRPWRWTLIICGCIPLARLFAAHVLHIFTERAQIYEAFAAFLTGNAGAYAGSLGRSRTNDLWAMIRSPKKK